MKKALVFSFLMALLSFPLFSQTQEQGDARFHAIGTYGLKWKEFGVGAGIEYFFIEHFAIMPSFTNYFPNVGNRTNFSVDLRYYISEGASQLYLMAGYSQNWENTQPGNPGVRRTFNGANVGVGAYIRIVDWVGLSTEFRFQSQTPREAGFRVGLAFPL
ncbi:MAG: hypothetical protein HWE09_03585 [Cyclobacteriaceae bacterium]|nr:hypothetical protein [Cyclobacteriaceae bacterium]